MQQRRIGSAVIRYLVNGWKRCLYAVVPLTNVKVLVSNSNFGNRAMKKQVPAKRKQGILAFRERRTILTQICGTTPCGAFR